MLNEVLAGKYRIETQLGEGGWASVYQARNTELEQPVALKVISERLLGEENACERFLNEARLLSELNHPNVVHVYDYGVLDDGRPYYVMELVSSTTLDDLIEQRQRLQCQDAIPIFKQIASALQAIHSKGILHRDLKPGNIAVGADGSVKLLDFGLAKQLESSSASFTRAGETIGTPAYMSPEQCMGKALDARSDIYSLGCLMYETLSGGRPFSASSVRTLLEQHVSTTANPIFDSSKPAIERAAERVVVRALEKDPARRYQSAADLAADLSLVLSKPQKIRRRQSSKQSRTKRTIMLSILVALVVAVATIIIGLGIHIAGPGTP